MLKHLMMILIMPLPPRLPPQSSRPSAPPALTVAHVSRPPAAVFAPATATSSDLRLSPQPGLRPPLPCLPPAPRPPPAQAAPPGRPCVQTGPGLGPQCRHGRPWVEPEAEPACGQGEDRAEGGARSLPVCS